MWCATRSGRVGEWQQAGILFRFVDGGKWLADSAKSVDGEAEGSSGNTADLDEWRGDRRQELVLIGPSLQDKQLFDLLDATLLTDEEMAGRVDGAQDHRWWPQIEGDDDKLPPYEGSTLATEQASLAAAEAKRTAQAATKDAARLRTAEAKAAEETANAEAVAAEERATFMKQQEEATTRADNRPEGASQRRWILVAWSLAIFTMLYNICEGAVSIVFGMKDESIALFGFGLDSLVEVLSAAVVLWRLKGDDFAEVSPSSCNTKEVRISQERSATKVIAVLLMALAVVTVIRAVLTLEKKEHPEDTVAGVVVSSASLGFMFALWYLKRKAAIKLDSATLEMDAACSLACIVLSSALFAGSLLGLLTKDVREEEPADSGDAEPDPLRSTPWWWTDSVTALIIAFWVGREGVVALRHALSDKFQGGCGCGKVGPTNIVTARRMLEQINARSSASSGVSGYAPIVDKSVIS